MFRQLQTILTIVQLYSKSGLVEKTIMYNSEHTAKFEISLPVTLCLLETVQDFLIKLDIKPIMHLLEISIFSLNNDLVRLTKL